MGDLRFRQNALNKLDAIHAIKKSMDKWLILWAEKECPIQVGDKYSVWLHDDFNKDMIVSKITARLIPDRKFVWYIEGWVTLSESKELHTATFKMEENNEI